LQYQYLKTLSQNPSNIVIGLVRTPSSVLKKVRDDGLQNVHIIQGDLNDAASLNAAAAQVSQLTNGVLDHLIVNGAYLSLAPLFLTPGDYVGKEALFIEELNNSMLTNVAGTLFSINAFMPLIKKSSIKKVIAISSALGDVEATQQAQVADNITYSISKVAINLLIAKFAISYKDEGVIFLALNPGFVYTMTDSLDTSELTLQMYYVTLELTFQ
jgi:NAD(P)-dependent dehydrogenase (short-subunit alcohol dehydrogenase family)